jgi:cardiolipin synthase
MSDIFAGPWWMNVLSIIGVLGLGTALITLFFKLGRRPDRIWSHAGPPLGSADFMRGIAGIVNAPVRRGGTAELLSNGDRYFPRMLEDFERAQRTINVAVYIWEPGDISEKALEVLARRAGEGIEVRVLVDAIGGLRIPDDAVERLRSAGGRVERYRPPVFGKLTRVHRRNHRRAVIIDGRIGYTGGAAFGDKWCGDARNEEEWRDDMVRLTGCAAGTLQPAFTELWAYTCGEILTSTDHYPDHDSYEDPGSAAHRIDWHTGVVSSPSADEYPLRLFFLLTFLSARERLYITTPYFTPDRNMRHILAERARAGVDVRVLVPNEHTDAAPIRRTSHHYYEALLAAGVRIYEYQPTMLHSKLLVADGIWSIVGSANMDIRSKELNNENIVAIQDESFAKSVEERFFQDLERAEEIELDEWRKRPWRGRVLERLSALFAEQY